MMNNIRSASEMALKVLEDDGWCKGAFLDDEGRRCIAGSYLPVVGYCIGDDEYAGLVVDYGRWSLPRWNDAKHRRFNDVRAALLAAASLEMSENEAAQ